MTNAEKYQEVFGFKPEVCNCPTDECEKCPEHNACNQDCLIPNWWNEEYKGNDTVKVEVTEVHTFAKPDDVSGIKFGD